MKRIVSGKRFRKDLKRYRNQTDKLKKLYGIVSLLQTGSPIPKENRPHKLTGNYAGHMECHIENDFLLIWIDEETETIKLVRLGSHSELFVK